MKETVGIKGKLTLRLFDKDGNLKSEMTVPNLIMDVGKDYIASRIMQGTATVMSHMAVGTSNANNTDSTLTTLSAQVGRVALTSTTLADNVVEYEALFPAGTGTGALVEAGIFNNVSAGTMLCRTTFSVVNKSASDTLTINWIITIS
jgi:hypothetical protein